MGNCCGSAAEVHSLSPPPPPPQTTKIPAPVVFSRASTDISRPPSRSHSRTGSLHESTARSRLPSQHDLDPRVKRRKSAPEPPALFNPSLPPESRPRTKSAANPNPRKPTRSESRPRATSTGRRASTRSHPVRRPLASKVQQVLSETPQFRILIVGKRGSGKSSLINAAFRVNLSAARGSDIDVPSRPDENHRLIVHEFSGLEPGDALGLRIIRDFINRRTDPSCTPAERLHAVWICITTRDAKGKIIGEGINEILKMRRVPAVVAFTKSDLTYPDITGSESGDYQYWDPTMTRAYTQCNELSISLFHREARDVPAALVSVVPKFSALINNLAVTTDRFIMRSRTSPSSRTSPASLAWSVALRTSQDITIQASIEIGRNQYWCDLWSSNDFKDKTLENCVNAIHSDIVEIWNLYDKDKYLSSNKFKIKMSHVVKDLAVPAGGAPPSDWNVSGDQFANWVSDVYRGSQENVRCMMGYIVNLTVILDDIFRTTITGDSVTRRVTLEVIDRHTGSGNRDRIHRDIRSFVAETYSIRFSNAEKDLALENIVDLIRRYCPT